MKNSAYRNSKIKHQLSEKKKHGVKEVIWRLNPQQVEYIEKYLHYKVEPYLYEVKTKPIQGIKFSDSKLLKEIHYKSKKGIKTLTRALTHKAIELLDDHEINYRPLKFKIHLIE